MGAVIATCLATSSDDARSQFHCWGAMMHIEGLPSMFKTAKQSEPWPLASRWRRVLAAVQRPPADGDTAARDAAPPARARAHTCAGARSHTHTSLPLSLTSTYTYTYAHTHARTHTHPCTYTHIHTRANARPAPPRRPARATWTRRARSRTSLARGRGWTWARSQIAWRSARRCRAAAWRTR